MFVAQNPNPNQNQKQKRKSRKRKNIEKATNVMRKENDVYVCNELTAIRK